jgi:hypothetical protein
MGLGKDEIGCVEQPVLACHPLKQRLGFGVVAIGLRGKGEEGRRVAENGPRGGSA